MFHPFCCFLEPSKVVPHDGGNDKGLRNLALVHLFAWSQIWLKCTFKSIYIHFFKELSSHSFRPFAQPMLPKKRWTWKWQPKRLACSHPVPRLHGGSGLTIWEPLTSLNIDFWNTIKKTHKTAHWCSFTANIAVPGLVSFVNVKEGAVNCNDFHSVSSGGTLKTLKQQGLVFCVLCISDVISGWKSSDCIEQQSAATL